MRSRRALLPLLAVCALFAGCGVSFRDGDEGTEFFKSLTVTGSLTAGVPQTASVTYEQANPVHVEVKCELRQGREFVKDLGYETVQFLPVGGPEATPFPGNFSLDFTVDEPGTYKASCFTPLDEDNYINRTFTIRPAPTPSPSATPPATGE
ncbi:MAG: hypothetical protein HY874_00840 [Chloroflexi bacterium]|nr:hypothetical protein [Chloroflexota bacterium]